MPDGPPNNQEVLARNKFQPGKSGNPGGRPKSLMKFRTRCRNLSREILTEIKKRLGEADLPDLVAAFQAVSDRGGYLTAKDQANIDTGNARLALALLAIETLTGDQRQKVVEALERGFGGGGEPG